jgi:hypothetical protein
MGIVKVASMGSSRGVEVTEGGWGGSLVTFGDFGDFGVSFDFDFGDFGVSFASTVFPVFI